MVVVLCCTYILGIARQVQVLDAPVQQEGERGRVLGLAPVNMQKYMEKQQGSMVVDVPTVIDRRL